MPGSSKNQSLMGIVPLSTSDAKKKGGRWVGPFVKHHFPLPREPS